MKRILKSRGPQVNMETCVAQAGGSRYDLVLMAAGRAREIKQQQSVQGHDVVDNPVVTALIEIEAGEVSRDYILR